MNWKEKKECVKSDAEVMTLEVIHVQTASDTSTPQ